MSVTETSIHRVTEIDISPIAEERIGERPYWRRKITIVTAEGEVEFSLFADIEDGLKLHF